MWQSVIFIVRTMTWLPVGCLSSTFWLKTNDRAKTEYTSWTRHYSHAVLCCDQENSGLSTKQTTKMLQTFASLLCGESNQSVHITMRRWKSFFYWRTWNKKMLSVKKKRISDNHLLSLWYCILFMYFILFSFSGMETTCHWYCSFFAKCVYLSKGIVFVW